MPKNTAPWLLAALAMLAVYPAAHLVGPAETKPPAAARKAPAPARLPMAGAADETCKAATGGAAAPWCEPVRLLREYLGLPAGPELGRAASLAELAGVAGGEAGYRLEVFLALVPDPLDSRLPLNFDQALDAIQGGFAESEYLLDRVWLPWDGDAAKRGTVHRSAPGVLLFRKRQEDGSRRLAVVLLVGETPKSGVHKEALYTALDLAADLEAAAGDRVALLGPSFSGSAESLRLALTRWRATRARGKDRPRLYAVTGSATASGLERLFEDLGVPFCRTVVPDDVVQRRALEFLHKEMGWDLRKIALLTESDTAYGRGPMRTGGTADLVLVQFPSHISDLRNAAGDPAKTPEVSKALQEMLQPSRPALDLTLKDSDQPVDLIPAFDPLTTRANDLMLSNLLETISREGIRYVGVLATDVKDKLFLAERIRRFAPDTVLFTFDNNLLYAHPEVGETMDGLLVFSSSPLFTEGAPWLPAATASRERRQYTSELQQGVRQAVRYLLDPGSIRPPDAWISAVGNGTPWPIARLPVSAGLEHSLCLAPPSAVVPPRGLKVEWAIGKLDLQMLLAVVALVVLSIRLRRVALLVDVAGAPVGLAATNRRLLALGTLLLALAAGLLAVVGSLPFQSLSSATEWDSLQVGFLAALALGYALLVRDFVLALRDRVGGAAAIAWGLAGGLALFALSIVLQWWWIPGGREELFYFHLRARAFASGLSPLVSLAALGGAVYAWLHFELERRRLMARQATDCPLEALDEPAVAGCGGVLREIRDLLIHTLPTERRLWALPLVAFGPPGLFLWSTLQPIGETRAYGRCFLLLFLVALALGALSFFRFLRLWWWTRRLLQRLDDTSPALAEAFTDVSGDLEWRPMKSFALQIPPFRTPVLSVRRLRSLVAAGKLQVAGFPGSVDRALTGVFENATPDGSAGEIASRNALEAIFAQACNDLKGKAGEPEVRAFLAMRIAAYLRYIFAHLRNCLLGALTSGFLVLVAVSVYAFEPKQFVSLAVRVALAAAVVLTLWVFIRMDRNHTLSRIGGTKPGEVTFDRTFFSTLLTYAGIPALGLIATQFPDIAGLLSRLAQQLLRVTGGG